jgi:hypothetical protein
MVKTALFRTAGGGALLALAALALSATSAGAVPAFAMQTGQACAACHVGGFGPQLTPFGREFKMHGYTTRTVDFDVPLSAMAITSYVRTDKGQPAAPAPDFNTNDNVAVDQVSLFLAGGVGSHFGGFVQTTYDGVARAFHWDNMDLRAVTDATIKGVNLIFGLSLNNAPTVQDAFNTLPAWGYPYTSSTLAPSPGAAPLIGALAQNTIGLTGYVWVNDEVYAEAGAYASPGSNFLRRAGIDPTDPGPVDGLAPYARLAWQKNFGEQNFEVGGFFLQADLNPGGDRSTGSTDHYTDIGADASYQYFFQNKDIVTLNARYTNEQQQLDATRALGGASNDRDTLQDLRFDASYYWRGQVGATIGGFDTFGSADPLLYAANRTLKPDSSGLLFQIDGTPFGAGKSPFGPRFNMRVGAQYLDYFTFDGAGRDFDAAGHGASDNNTFRLFAWIAY